jgi:hypothetical protein
MRVLMTVLSVVIVTARLARGDVGSPCEPAVADDCNANFACSAEAVCRGVPVNEGMPCTNDTSAGCMGPATCHNGICMGSTPAADGTACNYPGLEKCYSPGHCMSIAGVVSYCVLGQPKVCPGSTDPCKISVCNPQTGECVMGDKCYTYAGCETCNAGVCQPTNIGQPCTNADGDFNPCTTDDRCVTEELSPGAGLRGICQGSIGGTGQPTATPQPSPSPTPTVPALPTSTPTVNLPATATPTGGVAATSTPTPVGTGGCVGDCDGSGDVTVDELLRMVNISLGTLPVGDCSAGDANGDGEITVDEIVRAVNNALNGC